MNINFEDIITKANARKDALVELSTELVHADKMYQMLEEITTYAERLQQITRKLDDEGKLMIPFKIRCPLVKMQDTIGHLVSAKKETLRDTDIRGVNYLSIGFSALLEPLE